MWKKTLLIITLILTILTIIGAVWISRNETVEALSKYG